MTHPAADDRNAHEIAFWNGPGGQRWLNRQQAQDALLAPVAEVLFDRAAARVGEIVLDIGCGCGATSIDMARRVAPAGRVLGIDVSLPMLERARQLAPKGLPVDFALADATVYPFEPIDLSFDLANGRGLDAAVDTALNMGPVSRALDGRPAALRAAAAESIRAALAQYLAGDTVPLPGALWIVTATNP